MIWIEFDIGTMIEIILQYVVPLITAVFIFGAAYINFKNNKSQSPPKAYFITIQGQQQEQDIDINKRSESGETVPSQPMPVVNDSNNEGSSAWSFIVKILLLILIAYFGQYYLRIWWNSYLTINNKQVFQSRVGTDLFKYEGEDQEYQLIFGSDGNFSTELSETHKWYWDDEISSLCLHFQSDVISSCYSVELTRSGRYLKLMDVRSGKYMFYWRDKRKSQ